MGLQIQIFKASTSREIEEAFATFVRLAGGGKFPAGAAGPHRSG
jgi:hypothetical protein